MKYRILKPKVGDYFPKVYEWKSKRSKYWLPGCCYGEQFNRVGVLENRYRVPIKEKPMKKYVIIHDIDHGVKSWFVVRRSVARRSNYSIKISPRSLARRICKFLNEDKQ